MLKKNLKRLPVTDEQGKLTGILSRMDIFKTISSQTPDWNAILKQNVLVGNLQYVSDIMRRDVHTVLPDTPIEEVLQIIDSNDIQRVAVVNKDNLFLGMISDRNLLTAFSDQKEGIWEFFAGKLRLGHNQDQAFSRRLRSQTASQVMKTNPMTILENAAIDDAIRLMTEKMIKRLPVVDAAGKFKGMLSRESLLRAGFSSL